MLVRVVFHRLILNKHVTLQLLIKVFEFICGKFVSFKHAAKSRWMNKYDAGKRFWKKEEGVEEKLPFCSFKSKYSSSFIGPCLQ